MVQLTLKLSDDAIERLDRIVEETNRKNPLGTRATRTSVVRDLLGAALQQQGKAKRK